MNSSRIFCWPVRVYYEDTDHGGVVYNANYLKFLERSRTEFLRIQGITQQKLIDDLDLIFAVRRVELDFLRPAKFDDLLLVTTQMATNSRVKINFKQQIYTTNNMSQSKTMNGFFSSPEELKNNSDLLCEAVVTIASLSAAKLKPKRMPETIIEELMREH